MTKITGFLGGVVLVVAASSAVSWAAEPQAPRAIDELNAQQQAMINQGKQVYIEKAVSGSAWPQMIVYQPVQATPEEGAAVMYDFEAEPQFLPDVYAAKIVNRVDPATVDVTFTIKAPIVNKDTYTVRNHLSTYSGGDSGTAYRLDWTLVQSKDASEITGNARLESLGTGALLVYTSFVKPTNMFAGLVKNQIASQLQETIASAAKQVNAEHIAQSAELQEQISALTAALGTSPAPAASAE